jgi:hypothetical protein
MPNQAMDLTGTAFRARATLRCLQRPRQATLFVRPSVKAIADLPERRRTVSQTVNGGENRRRLGGRKRQRPKGYV